MTARLREIAGRRRFLVAKAAAQRNELEAQAGAMRESLGFAELVWRGYHQLRSRPVGIVLAATALAALGPGKLLRLAYRSGFIAVAVLRLLRIFRALR